MVLSSRKASWFPIPWSFPPGKRRGFQFHGPSPSTALYGSPVKRIGPTGLPTFCTLHAQADPAVVAGDFNLLLDELQSLWPALSGRITAIPENLKGPKGLRGSVRLPIYFRQDSLYIKGCTVQVLAAVLKSKQQYREVAYKNVVATELSNL